MTIHKEAQSQPSQDGLAGQSLRSSIFYVGGVLYGLSTGLMSAVIYTLVRKGLSLDAFLSARFVITLVIFLTLFYGVGCVFGLVLHNLISYIKSAVDK